MCYDISFTVDIRVLSDYFPGLVYDEQIRINFDAGVHIQGAGAFAEHAIVYRNREDLLPHCRPMEWGVIPHLVDTPDALAGFLPGRQNYVAIRSERVLDDKDSYWYKIRNRRCLIPVTGTYEHREVNGWTKKVPYHIRPVDQLVSFIPGLYCVSQVNPPFTGNTATYRTFGLITRPANIVMRQIHNSGRHPYRMPLFLTFGMAKQWLSHELSEYEYRKLLNYEMPSDMLSYHTTDTIRTSKQRADGKPKNAPFLWANLPALGKGDPVLFD